MYHFQALPGGRRASFVSALLLLVALLLAACGDATATAVPAPTTVAATTAPTTAPAPTTIAATSTPVLIATARPTATPAPTTVAATTAPASTTSATKVPTSASATTTSVPLFGTTTTAAVGATPTALATKITQGQILNFDADGAYKHVRTLAGDIGLRVAGSENQKKAAAYIAKQFESFGLKNQFQESNYGWQHDIGSTLTVAGETPIKLRLQVVSSTAQRQTEASLVYFDTTSPDDLKLENKVVLLDESNLNNNAFVQKVVKLQPLAILIIPAQPDPLMSPSLRVAGTLSVGYIEQAAGKQLAQRATQSGLNVKLNFNWEKTDITVRNVIGTRPAAGNAPDAPIIIIGGHYDSVPEGPGANDNGSGTATTIELARVLAKAYPEVEFRFIAFDAEELGLIGSRDYVSKISPAEKSRIQAMINIDMIAVGQKLSVSGKKVLAGIAKGVALDLGFRDVDVVAVERAGGGSDHASFDQGGIPFLSFDRFTDPNYHRSSDTPDKFTKEPLDKVAQLTLGTLQRFLLSQN